VSVAAVILAAGASRRMGAGRPKQLMELEGEPLVHRAARIALQAGCSPTLVVLGYQAEDVEGALAGLPVIPVVNTMWNEGMASSIRAGFAEVPLDATAAMVMACDQPAVDGFFLTAMMHAHCREPHRIIAAAYSGAVGIPALFPRRCFEAMEGLAGDRGARALLSEPDVLGLPLPGGELDLDTLHDFEEARRRMDPP